MYIRRNARLHQNKSISWEIDLQLTYYLVLFLSTKKKSARSARACCCYIKLNFFFSLESFNTHVLNKKYNMLVSVLLCPITPFNCLFHFALLDLHVWDACKRGGER